MGRALPNRINEGEEAVDFTVIGRGHDTVLLLRPNTEEAEEWVNMHLPEDAMRMGLAYAIENRYLGPIVEGIIADGLTVE